MPVTVRYAGSLVEHHGIACLEDDPERAGRFVLRMWDGRTVLRGVRRESVESGVVSVFPGAVCRCGLNHDRSS